MKKKYAILTAFFLTILAVLFVLQCALLHLGYRDVLEKALNKEIETVQGMAGALLNTHPELEGEIAAALKPDSLAQYQPAGADTLSRYGLDREAVSVRERYVALEASWNGRLLLMTAITLAAFAILAFYLHQRDKQQKDEILAVLERYLSEDYTFATSLEDLPGTKPQGRDGHLSDLLKQMGNAFQLKNQRLTQEQESTKSLVTDISHQLKNPIASLKTCLDLALEAEDMEEREEFLGHSSRQIEKMESLTEALISISRMETAMIELCPAMIDLKELVIRAVNAVYEKARTKDISLELLPFADISLLLDERWTAKALTNVLENAIKYSPAGSVIHIGAELLISYVRITVADEGIGIPAEEQARVFQRFYRGSHPAVKAAEGAGVGLYLTRILLERQSGGITVKSRPGKGTVFAIQLPKHT